MGNPCSSPLSAPSPRFRLLGHWKDRLVGEGSFLTVGQGMEVGLIPKLTSSLVGFPGAWGP